MADPLTTTTWQSLLKLWANSGRLLWTLTTAIAAGSGVLALAAHFGVSSAEKLLAEYGIWLIVGLPVLLVFSISKTLEERAGAKRHQPISLIPDGQQCHWSQSKQTSGEMITAIALRFQVTNVSDGDVKLSAIRLSRPWVKQRRVLQALLAVRHHTDNHHSFDFPVFAHQFTYVSAHVLISGAVGRPGKPMRVVVDIQDHARRWYRLTFPIVRFAGPTPNQR